MFEKTEQWQWIDAYLNGQLSEKELQEFTQRLQKEPVLLEAVQEHQEMISLMEQDELLQLKKQAKNLLQKVSEQKQQTVETVNIIELETEEDIQDIDDIEEVQETSEQLVENVNTKEAVVIPMRPSTEGKQGSKKVATIGRGWRYYVTLAAAISLLFFVPYYLHQLGIFTLAVKPTKLAEIHYQAPDRLSYSAKRVAVSNAVSEKDSLMKAANQFYIEQGYGNALLLLKQLPISDSMLFDQGICYFQMDDIPNAIRLFKEVLNHTDTEVEEDDQAKWYLTLAYLKDNQKENARKLLQAISEQKDNWKKDEASQMLKQLK